MALMHAPRTGPGTRRSSRAKRESDPIAELEKLQDTLDLGGHSVELIEGRLVVSPAPAGWHALAVTWLMDELRLACEKKAWMRSSRSDVELSQTRERIEPDLVVLAEFDEASYDQSLFPARQVMLAAEVVSRSSVREDREVKPRSCALAGIPFYLLIDRYAEPATVTLYSKPGEAGYAKADPVSIGGKLRIPEPFGIVLDTSGLPLPRPAANQGRVRTPKA